MHPVRTQPGVNVYRYVPSKPSVHAKRRSLDTRHTNIALEMRKLGYDPTLAGYTDTTRDPRQISAYKKTTKSLLNPKGAHPK